MSTFSNPLTDYSPQMEAFEFPDLKFDTESSGPFTAHEEMGLASELLELVTEQDLDQFLRDLINKVGKSVGNFVRSPIGRAIGGVSSTYSGP